MIRRTIHVVVIVLYYISMHEILYRIFLSLGIPSTSSDFTWWWLWGMAIPITTIGIIIPIVAIRYIKGDLQ